MTGAVAGQVSVWRAEGIGFGYPGADGLAVEGISLAVEPGTFTAVLGPNGSGKSTLMRLLLGTLRPRTGSISFLDRPLAAWDRAALAREIGVVPQGEEIAFPIGVREMVAMGRYPHLGSWRREGDEDRLAIEEAMRRCDVAHLASRALGTLSGGEQQRVRLARALAQRPGVLTLDEPTAALDIRHEMSIFELLRELGSSGVTVLLSTHHLNLAARYAGRLILLDRGRLAADGTPEEVVRRHLLEEVHRWPVRTTTHPGPGPDTGAPQVTPLSGEACSQMQPDHPGPTGPWNDPSHDSRDKR